MGGSAHVPPPERGEHAGRAQDGEDAEGDPSAPQERRVERGGQMRIAHDEREQEQDQRHAEHLAEQTHGAEDA